MRHVILCEPGLSVFAALACALGAGSPAAAISRDEVMVRAKAFAFHPWRCTTANLTASCSTTYRSEYIPGDYVGLPYDWGGYMTLFEFDQQIAQAYGAGSYPADGVLSCTSGLDCSGYVSKCWDTGHYTTSSIPTISQQITQAELLPGDVFNKAGSHVVLYSHTLPNGEPVFYESAGYNVHRNASGGWSWVSGYIPRRYNGITGTTATDPAGSPQSPIVIGAFAYADSRDTRQSKSDVLDGCGAAPTLRESGPEYIYQANFTVPGSLTVTVASLGGADIDVHLYTSINTGDCIARGDTTFTSAVDCGTYYIVVDTFVSTGGTAYPGIYNLSATFTPSGQPCGIGPPAYHPGGTLGSPCAYPGRTDLPFCNENLGGEVCIYSTNPAASFCSKACSSVNDCASGFPGGCCRDISSGEFYCMPASWCPTMPDGGAPDAGPRPDAGSPDSGPGNDAGITADGGPYPDGGFPPDGSTDDAGSPPADGGAGADGSGLAGGGPSLLGWPHAGTGADGSTVGATGTGCQCDSGGGAPLVLWCLLGLVGLRAVRRRLGATFS